MSYASSDKSFPALLKRLPETLSHPTAIAVIASVGIHAALGLSLPYLPISSQEKPKPVRNVQLLELNPDEMNRVPSSSVELPPLPPGLNQQLKPLSPSSPSASSSLPGLPSLSSTDPSVSDFSSLGSLPSLSGGLSGRVGQRSTNLDKSARRNNPLLSDLEQPLLPHQRLKDKSGKISTTTPFKIATGAKITPTTNRRERFDGLPGGLSRSSFVPQLPDTSSSNQTPEPLQPIPMSPLAANPGFTGSQSPTQFGTPGSIQSPGQTIQGATPTSGQRNVTGSDDRIVADYVRQLDDWKKRNQVDGDPEPLPIVRGNYPQKARGTGVSAGSVQVNWKVDKNGNIISDSLQIIGSSDAGGVFDQEAIAAVRKIAIPVTGQEKAYTVRVIFIDDSKAPASSTESSTTPTESKTPTEQLRPTERQSLPVQVTPSPSPTAPEWSTPTERQIPLFRQNLPEQSTPTETKTPTERVTPTETKTPTERVTPTETKTPTERVTPTETKTPTERVTPTETKTPTERVTPTETKTPTERVTPTETKTPTERVTPTESKTPTERVTPTESKTPTEPVTPTETKTPTERVTPTESKTPTERKTPAQQLTPTEGKKPTEQLTPIERPTPRNQQNSSERSTSTGQQNSSEGKTPAQRQNSPEPRRSSESQNSEKPQRLPEPQNSEKPQRLPEPPNPARR